jgi:glycosyltransferase involved in cell wall biosynthesis
LKIAVTVDPYVPTPPRYYGGIERVVDFLVRGLLARGHEVTLLAHPDSEFAGTVVGYGVPPHTGSWARARELWQVGSYLRRHHRRLDVVHSFGRLAALLPILPARSLPKVQSYQRDELPLRGIRRARALAGASLRFTACSTQMYARRKLTPKDGEWATIYNGVDLDKYTLVPSVAPDAPLMFLGRIERIKGTHHAIALAKASSRRLVIAGNIADQAYFDDAVAPALDGDTVRYVGPVDDAAKNDLLGRAAALLMMIEWDEPFGIVMAEAMACGTPVVGFARGSVPEVVRDGVSGFAVTGLQEAVSAVARLGSLPRVGVRRDAEGRFGSEVIVSAYERLYETMLATSLVERRAADVPGEGTGPTS